MVRRYSYSEPFRLEPSKLHRSLEVIPTPNGRQNAISMAKNNLMQVFCGSNIYAWKQNWNQLNSIKPRRSMVLLYMVTWIPSIYPLYVSIYTSTMDPSWESLCFHYLSLASTGLADCAFRNSSKIKLRRLGFTSVKSREPQPTCYVEFILYICSICI